MRGNRPGKIYAIEQDLAKTGSGPVVVLDDMPHDFGQIV
jgi:hypothetical protein